MLTHLQISNYALISTLDISFTDGFSVITGETGAGKSIVLGALSLLLGARADISAITEGEKKCVIEGEFNISGYSLEPLFAEEGLDYSDSCIIRRELLSTGKSRSFVNDTPVGLSLLRTLASKLIDIHSQHENLLLSDDMFCLRLLDSLADNKAEKDAYTAAYEQYQQVLADLANLKKEAAESQRNAEFIAFQWQQLSDANLTEGELETLLEEQQRLAHAEEIAEALQSADLSLSDEDNGVMTQVKAARNAVRRIAAYLPAASDLTQRLESSYIELQDIADTISHELQSIDNNPLELQQTEERIATLQTLLRKFGKETVEELISERERYKSMLDRRDSFSFDISRMEEQAAQTRTLLLNQAGKLRKTREAVIANTEKRLAAALLKLGVRHAIVQIKLQPLADCQADGMDEAVMLFAANLNQTPMPVAEVASGGEMSRLMLAIKALVAEKHALPTLIFDEVDTGVSGEVAEEMAHTMLEIAATRQVITITHLPQIAAKGKQHYKVYKQDTTLRTETHIRLLSEEERVTEIATLLSGSKLTDEALANARQLLS
ncbi:MAG: DNA repair protein RecN [Paludibacteraceae bacterium]|nr:DNA repair protein RecN [Paludibacteraceae bacterium]